MAMRLYTGEEMETELSTKWGLTRTETVIAGHRFWKTPAGKHIPFPDLDADQRYPDHLIDKLVERLSDLGENPFE